MIVMFSKLLLLENIIVQMASADELCVHLMAKHVAVTYLRDQTAEMYLILVAYA
jgi:hypothetical protein